MASKQQTVTVAGKKLKLTSLDKVIFPETETTKAEVIEYLQTVAGAMLPHMRRRAVTRKRWPDGPGTAEKPNDAFFRKNLEESAPAWVPRLGLQHSDHPEWKEVISRRHPGAMATSTASRYQQLTEEQRAKIEPLLPSNQGCEGSPFVDSRKVVEP